MTNTERIEHRFRLSTGWRVLVIAAVILALITGVLAWTAALYGPATSEPSSTIATAEVDGRSVAVVVYKTNAFGAPDLFRTSSMGLITVVDAVSGEVLGSNPAEGGLLDAAIAPAGQSVVLVDRFLPGVLPNWATTPVTTTVLLISPEGELREIVLAPHGWLGLPW